MATRVRDEVGPEVVTPEPVPEPVFRSGMRDVVATGNQQANDAKAIEQLAIFEEAVLPDLQRGIGFADADVPRSASTRLLEDYGHGLSDEVLQPLQQRAAKMDLSK